MIKLSSLLPSKFKKKQPEEKLFDKDEVINSDTWTHATWSGKLINLLLKGKDYIGKDEDLKDFNVVKNKVHGQDQANIHAPNFKKGSIFYGYESQPYLITTDLDDKAFQPNWNSINYDNLEDSQNVAVLRPEYRDAKHFKLWKRVRIDDKDGRAIKYKYKQITEPVPED